MEKTYRISVKSEAEIEGEQVYGTEAGGRICIIQMIL